MRKPFLSLLFILILPFTISAQIKPAENKQLNYRLIGFTFPADTHSRNYDLEIASGSIFSQDSFQNNIIKVVHGTNNKIIAEVPTFGAQYTWRITSNDHAVTHSDLHHFSTLPSPDSNLSRLRISTRATKYNDAYLFLDGSNAMYDIKGNLLWFLPNINDKIKSNASLRDLKPTPFGTITFITGNDAYEIDYDGNIVWHAPHQSPQDTIPHYHHDFTRLSNGHYMILDNVSQDWEISNANDSALSLINQIILKKENGKWLQTVELGTVVEYDSSGKLIWSWKTSDYIHRSDLENKVNKLKKNYLLDIDIHLNSFFFDEHSKILYLSFRNISRIIGISYPDGKVISTYGKLYDNTSPDVTNGIFCNQHSCKYSPNGYLYVYNNNACNVGQLPSIVKFKKNTSAHAQINKLWEYTCTMEAPKDPALKAKPDNLFMSGGSVTELSGKEIFACMGGKYSKLLIVDMNKKILWSAIAERYIPKQNKWEMIQHYRAAIVENRKELEPLIFGK